MSFGGTLNRAASALVKFRHFIPPPTRDPVSGLVPANVNVNLEVIPGHGHLVARTDGFIGSTIDPDTLVPLSRFKFSDIHPALRGPCSAAHSARDAATGETVNFVSGHWSDLRRYRVFRINKDGTVELLVDIRGPPASHVHSVVLTPGYVVIAITTWRLDLIGMLASSEIGLLVSIVIDARRNSSFILVLDARTMQEACRANTPEIVPQALHGMYISKQEIQ